MRTTNFAIQNIDAVQKQYNDLYTIKRVLLFIILFLLYNLISGQCLYNSENENNYKIDKRIVTSGNNIIDQKIEFLISQFNTELSANSKFYFYDDKAAPNAYANPKDSSIYIGLTLIENCYSLDSSLIGISFIIAHEMAHIYQFANKSNNIFFNDINISVINLELQADFLAAYIMGKTGKINMSTYELMLKQSRDIGDFSFTIQSHHGTPLQREFSVRRGFEHTYTTIENAYKQSFQYIKPDYFNDSKENELIYSCLLKNDRTLYILYGGKVCEMNSSNNYTQVGQMVPKDLSSGYLYTLDFSSVDNSDLFISPDNTIYNDLMENVGYMTDARTLTTSGDATKKLFIETTNITSQPANTFNIFTCEYKINSFSSTRSHIRVIVKVPYGYYKNCLGGLKNFVKQGYERIEVFLEPNEIKDIKITKTLSRSVCSGIGLVEFEAEYIEPVITK